MDIDRINYLCAKYDIAVFKVADSCFAYTSEPEEQEKWFISTLANEARFHSDVTHELSDSENEAKVQAIRVFGLDNLDRL